MHEPLIQIILVAGFTSQFVVLKRILDELRKIEYHMDPRHVALRQAFEPYINDDPPRNPDGSLMYPWKPM